MVNRGTGALDLGRLAEMNDLFDGTRANTADVAFSVFSCSHEGLPDKCSDTENFEVSELDIIPATNE
jgi:hypothetical protein